MGKKTRGGRVANSDVSEDQLVIKEHGEIGARAVDTIQTGFVPATRPPERQRR